jgi:hypothetical protein
MMFPIGFVWVWAGCTCSRADNDEAERVSYGRAI